MTKRYEPGNDGLPQTIGRSRVRLVTREDGGQKKKKSAHNYYYIAPRTRLCVIIIVARIGRVFFGYTARVCVRKIVHLSRVREFCRSAFFFFFFNDNFDLNETQIVSTIITRVAVFFTSLTSLTKF